MTDRIAQKLAREAHLAALKRDSAPGWLTIKAYCYHYSITRWTLGKWLEAGLLTTYRVGRTVRIKHEPPKDSRPPDVVAG